MTRRWLILCLAPMAVFSQNRPAMSFEAASVKPADPNQRAVDFIISPGGRLRVINATLAEIIHEAYALTYEQITGGPGWISEARFNIDAKAAGEPTRGEMLAVLQTLLAERFQLKIRHETREGNVFELVVAKNGFKPKPSVESTSRLWLERNTPRELPGVSYTINGRKVSIARLADHLMGYLRRPVLDHTGITGEFDFRIDYAIEGHSDTGPSIFTALQEQLGLRLKTVKGPIEAFVIEGAERPMEN